MKPKGMRQLKEKATVVESNLKNSRTKMTMKPNTRGMRQLKEKVRVMMKPKR